MEPKVGDRIPGLKYDILMPKDIEPYLNGRSWEDLKVGDEIAFPEPDGSAPTGESLVGLTLTYELYGYEEESTFTSFDAKTGMHTIEGGAPGERVKPVNLRELPDEVKSKFTFEGSDAYFASADPEMMLGLCTIGELGVCSLCRSVGVLSSVLHLRPAAPSSFLTFSFSLLPSFILPCRSCSFSQATLCSGIFPWA